MVGRGDVSAGVVVVPMGMVPIETTELGPAPTMPDPLTATDEAEPLLAADEVTLFCLLFIMRAVSWATLAGASPYLARSI